MRFACKQFNNCKEGTGWSKTQSDNCCTHVHMRIVGRDKTAATTQTNGWPTCGKLQGRINTQYRIFLPVVDMLFFSLHVAQALEAGGGFDTSRSISSQPGARRPSACKHGGARRVLQAGRRCEVSGSSISVIAAPSRDPK